MLSVIYLLPPRPVVVAILAFGFGLLPLAFVSNLKLHLAIVNVYVTVFSFIGTT